MGCWNATCGLSGLPILSRDKVVFLILESQDCNLPGSDGCEATDYYKPITLPFRGEYNDYGCVQNAVSDWNTETFANWFKQTLAEDKFDITGDSRGVNNNSDFLNIIRSIECGHVQKKGERPAEWIRDENGDPTGRCTYKPTKSSLLLFMTHEHVWNAFQNLHQRLEDSYRREYAQKRQNEQEQSIQNLIAKVIAEELTKRGLYTFLPMHEMFDILVASGLARTYEEYLENMKSAEEVNNFFDLAKELKNAIYSMSFLRKGFSFQIGKGSQSENWETHANYHRQMADFAGQKKKERDEYMKQFDLPEEEEEDGNK